MMNLTRQQLHEQYCTSINLDKVLEARVHYDQCAYCETELHKDNRTKDHLIPKTLLKHLSQKERDIFAQFFIVPCCYKCNHFKSHITIDKWAYAPGAPQKAREFVNLDRTTIFVVHQNIFKPMRNIVLFLLLALLPLGACKKEEEAPQEQQVEQLQNLTEEEYIGTYYAYSIMDNCSPLDEPVPLVVTDLMPYYYIQLKANGESIYNFGDNAKLTEWSITEEGFIIEAEYSDNNLLTTYNYHLMELAGDTLTFEHFTVLEGTTNFQETCPNDIEGVNSNRASAIYTMIKRE